MRKEIAERMKRSLDPFRQYLFQNEWNTICECIDHYIDDNPRKQQERPQQRQDDTPPLKAAWESAWTRKINAPLMVYLIIFGLGMLIGAMVW